MRAHVGERVLSSGGRGDGPLQQSSQEGPDQVLWLMGQLGVAGDIGNGHHDVLSYDLQQQTNISIRITDEISGPLTDL